METDQWLDLKGMNLLCPSCDGIDKMTGTDFMISNGCVFVKSKCLAVMRAVLFCSGSPQEYLEFYIFPVVLPGLAALLQEAEKEQCFEVSLGFSFQITGRKLQPFISQAVFFSIWSFARKPTTII